MKRKILLWLAVILLAVFAFLMSNTGAAILLGGLLSLLLGKDRFERAANKKSNERDGTLQSMDEVTGRYGEPDDLVVTDAARGQELQGAIPVYDRLGLMVINGTETELKDITDITFNNAGTPYGPPSYQVLIVTAGPPSRTQRIDVGYDAEWAKQIVLQLHRHLAR